MDLLELYKWTAVVSGVVFLGQLGSTLLGFDSDTSHADHDGDGGHTDGAHILLSFISVRNVVCFLLAFSVTGYFEVGNGMGAASIVPGVIAGTALVAFNIFLLRSMSRLKRDTSVKAEELIGQGALVVFTVLKERSGQGKVDVNINGRHMTLFAVTDEPQDIPRNTRIVIEQVMEGWLLLIRRA